jgi:hypothetical protein
VSRVTLPWVARRARALLDQLADDLDRAERLDLLLVAVELAAVEAAVTIIISRIEEAA